MAAADASMDALGAAAVASSDSDPAPAAAAHAEAEEPGDASADADAAAPAAPPVAQHNEYGAAAASLTDPACRPGTREFATAKAANIKIQQRYREGVAAIEAANEGKSKEQRQAKPDMKVWKELRDTSREGKYGHIAGVSVGDEFLGRGELAVLGLHSQIMPGIDARKTWENGATAIILSGGYKDDADEGDTFWYTGAGGQKDGSQVQHQTYDQVGNDALVKNFTTRTPVRVFRVKLVKQYDVSEVSRGSSGGGGDGSGGGKEKGKEVRMYVYEGLYRVVEHKREPGKDGFMVCQFRMQGVPGHSAVTAKVEYRCLQRISFRRVQLAAAGGRRGARSAAGGDASSKRRQTTHPGYAWDFSLPSPQAVARAIASRAAAGESGRLVAADIAGGQEKMPIAMWNSLDGDDNINTGVVEPLRELLNAKTPTSPGGLTAAAAAAKPRQQQQQEGAAVDGDETGFTYITDYIFGEQAAKDQAIAAELDFRSHFPHCCGIQYHGGHSLYTEDGQLTTWDPCGVMECDVGCVGCTTTAAGAAAGEGGGEEAAAAAAAGGGGGSQPSTSSCKWNTVTTNGIIYPLEVFKVAGKGWGVRCSVDIPIGAVLCPYVGVVITDRTAELLRGMDQYLFNLDHFHSLLMPEEAGMVVDGGGPSTQQQQQQQQNGRQQQQQQPSQQQIDRQRGSASVSPAAAAAAGGGGGSSPLPAGSKRKQQEQEQQQQHNNPAAAAAVAAAAGGDVDEGMNPNLPPLPTAFTTTHLVVDASHEGNVARFFNHSCAGNCMVQPVFAKSARSHLLYYNAIVAGEDIPRFTELTYNYKYQDHSQPQGASDPAAAAAGGGGRGDDGSSSGRRRGVPCRCGAANCCKWLLVE